MPSPASLPRTLRKGTLASFRPLPAWWESLGGRWKKGCVRLWTPSLAPEGHVRPWLPLLRGRPMGTLIPPRQPRPNPTPPAMSEGTQAFIAACPLWARGKASHRPACSNPCPFPAGLSHIWPASRPTTTPSYWLFLTDFQSVSNMYLSPNFLQQWRQQLSSFSTFSQLHRNLADIVSDRGPQFTSHVWRYVCTAFGVTASLSSSYHPQPNGQTVKENEKPTLSLKSAPALSFAPGFFTPPSQQKTLGKTNKRWESTSQRVNWGELVDAGRCGAGKWQRRKIENKEDKDTHSTQVCVCLWKCDVEMTVRAAKSSTHLLQSDN